MKKKFTIAVVLGVCVLMSVVSKELSAAKTEEPKYKVLLSQGNIELRQYAPLVVAEVTTSGSRKQAINRGFGLLAGYIFGNNTGRAKIAMTSPVTQQRDQKIAMTTPVTQQADKGNWLVRFVMPSQYSLDELPKPNNDEVLLKKVSAKKIIAIEFSGMATEKNIDVHEKQLQEYIREKAITTLRPPTYAFYNPPWTLPFLRRNEIMIEVE